MASDGKWHNEKWTAEKCNDYDDHEIYANDMFYDDEQFSSYQKTNESN